MDNRKNRSLTKIIRVYGIVQGVGFRPLVYRIAKKLKVNGTVRNVGGYVEIIAQAEEDILSLFLQEIKSGQEGGHEIVKLEVEDIVDYKFDDFIIIKSGISEEVSVIPPDLPVCPECQKELYHEADRRYLHPFISCMACGPRYTILEELPYDRNNTTMLDFSMCLDCDKEYTNTDSRRFHAQTISCHTCGPYLIYHDFSKKSHSTVQSSHKSGQESNVTVQGSHKSEQESNVTVQGTHILGQERIEMEAFDKAVNVILKGGIIAVKGIGGYHFVCSPFQEEAVQRLRKLKGREEKPFAVMFDTIEQIEACCIISEEERALLSTKARPIVLLYRHKDTMAPSTYKKSIYCGAFLPYTPLQMLLTKQCGPLIMTSANISDRPVIKGEEELLSLQSPELDGILYNKRRIIRSVDDSVAKIIDGKPQLIRRSRGYVPYPVFIQKFGDSLEMPIDNQRKELSGNQTIFAAGGDLKAAFCFYQNSSAVVSQYFGDLQEITVMEEYKKSYKDLSRLLKLTPSLAVCDLHPNYYSAQYAKALELPVLQIQHHHAHIASVMAEHDLRTRVIGIAFDGTGYGTDGNIWGGEFLICEGADFIRAGQLSYTPMLGGDQSMRDARKTASCYLLHHGLEEYMMDERMDILKAALKHKMNAILSSSMGRLFDAVASVLEIAHENYYEGDCAAALEREAVLAVRNHIKPEELTFAILEKDEIIEMNPRPLLRQLSILKQTKDIGGLALGFHHAVAEAVGDICVRLSEKYHSNTVALSGGVFQNTILTELTLKVLRQKGFQVYVNITVPPNDGGISLGQAYLGLMAKQC